MTIPAMSLIILFSPVYYRHVTVSDPGRPARPQDAHENPDVPHDPPDTPLAETRDIFRSVFSDLHEGHGNDSVEVLKTSSSNSFPHSLHLYS